MDGRGDGEQPVVVLLGGASGVGKTQLSHRLARHLAAALVEVDDLVVAAQALTEPRQHPALHHWRRHDSAAMQVGEVVDGQITLARAMEPAVAAVVRNHLDEGTPVVIEGDYLIPRPVTDPSVRAAVIHEDDIAQLIRNYRSREPECGDQHERARAGLEYGRWLASQAHRADIPVVAARPWSTGFDRLLAALRI